MATLPPPDRGAGDLAPYLRHVDICNAGMENKHEFVVLKAVDKEGDEADIGFIHYSLAMSLTGRDPPALAAGAARHVCLDVEREDFSEKLAAILGAMRADGLVPGWRDELYPAVTEFGAPPLFVLERAAAPLLGLKAYGVHVNGFVAGGDGGGKRLWVARRSASKATYPGRLDHLAAGGLSHGISPADNVVKECGEEAGIPPHLAARARAVGAVSYETISGRSYKRDVLFCYDLELPPDFVPSNTDGEAESFELLPVEEVAAILRRSDDYKPNCALVVIDFLMRHGYIAPEEKGYLALLRGLRRGDCS